MPTVPAMRADMLITDRQGHCVAVIEIKNRQDLPKDYAVIYRRNMLAHGALPKLPYFLLLSQDTGYLWHDGDHDALDAPPTVSFPMSAILRRYLKANTARRLTGAELELLVLQWLTDLVTGRQNVTDEPEKTLMETGFTESILGGAVMAEAAL